MPEQLGQIQKDLSDVQQRLKRVEREQRESLEKMAALEASVAGEDRVTRADFADIKMAAQENSRHLAVLREQVAETNTRLDRMSHEFQETRELSRRLSDLGTAGIERPGTGGEGTGDRPGPGPGADAVPDPEALYNAAYADFSKGNYALAISGFEEYAERFPESDLSDNALYWVGECHFSQGSFELAVESFDRLLEKYPESDRAAGSDLKKGLAFLEQNQVGKAIVQLRYVLTTYPSTDEARIARDKLVSLGASVR
jgi:tol-pal system protein YbgF